MNNELTSEQKIEKIKLDYENRNNPFYVYTPKVCKVEDEECESCQG